MEPFYTLPDSADGHIHLAWTQISTELCLRAVSSFTLPHYVWSHTSRQHKNLLFAGLVTDNNRFNELHDELTVLVLLITSSLITSVKGLRGLCLKRVCYIWNIRNFTYSYTGLMWYKNGVAKIIWLHTFVRRSEKQDVCILYCIRYLTTYCQAPWRMVQLKYGNYLY